MLDFYLPIAVIMAGDAVLLSWLAWAYHSERFAAHRISAMESMKISPRERLGNIAVSSVLSLVIVLGSTYAMYPYAFHSRPTPAWRIALEALAVLFVYDFAYYFLHRLMHHRRLMRFVHAIHHRVRNPTAMESFYLHPVELALGLALLMACVFAVGPVHTHSFAAVFLVHSTLNIVVHSGLLSGHWLLAPIDHLTRKHHVHHMEDFERNYASLTPWPDKLFGTYG